MLGVFGAEGDQVLSTLQIVEVASVATVVLVMHRLLRDTTLEAAVVRVPTWLLGVVWALMGGAILLTQGDGSAFIYFQF